MVFPINQLDFVATYTSRGHNLRFFGAVIFESAWSLTRSAIVILLSSAKDHADPKEQDKNRKL
jgi:hypothetical protein